MKKKTLDIVEDLLKKTLMHPFIHNGYIYKVTVNPKHVTLRGYDNISKVGYKGAYQCVARAFGV
jgi:hypothetical protein